MNQSPMLILIFLMVITVLFFSGCTKEPVYVKTKSPKLETLEVTKSDAETKKLNIQYKVIER